MLQPQPVIMKKTKGVAKPVKNSHAGHVHGAPTNSSPTPIWINILKVKKSILKILQLIRFTQICFHNKFLLLLSIIPLVLAVPFILSYTGEIVLNHEIYLVYLWIFFQILFNILIELCHNKAKEISKTEFFNVSFVKISFILSKHHYFGKTVKTDVLCHKFAQKKWRKMFK